MALLDNWPVIVDDDSTGQSGTVLESALFDAISTAIEDLLNSPSNPTISPADLIDEVVDARGSLGTLALRLAVALNDDGTPKVALAPVTTTDFQASLGALNLIGNGDFLIWPAGDAAAPSYWAVSNGTVARSSAVTKIGANSIQLTYSANPANLTQILVSAGAIAGAAAWVAGIDGNGAQLRIGFGGWVLASVGGIAGIVLDDGVLATSARDASGYTTAQTAGAWVWMSGVHTVSAGATHLQISAQITSAGNAYFSGMTALFSNYAPGHYVPCPMAYITVPVSKTGTLPTGVTTGSPTFLDSYDPERPGFLKDVRLTLQTAGATTDLKCDVLVDDGAGAYVSAFSTLPKIIAGAKRGSAQPDSATYSTRCLSGAFDAAQPKGSQVRFNLSQTDGASPGANLKMYARILQYRRPLEGFMGYADV